MKLNIIENGKEKVLLKIRETELRVSFHSFASGYITVGD